MRSPVELDLPICTASVVLAATSTYLVPALTPLSAAVLLYSCIPSFKNAYQVVVKERRVGVDVLDALVVLTCVATNRILAGKKLVLGDVIVIHTGEAVPVDGEVISGMVMIDQHTLTGESAPVEKIKGDTVLASTTLIAGKVEVAVTSAGDGHARAQGLDLPALEDSQYQVGYGIKVQVDGHTVRVGSARYMTHEGIALPPELQRELDKAHAEGSSLVMVGVDDALGGAVELCAAAREEAEAVIAGLRARGARHLAIISRDHEQPTRKLAERLGMDRYFAEVLPQDKARYVELLQREGRKVCFIGDGVNDSIALKRADVSISLRGASSVATDTAQVVFMEDNLLKLVQLHDVSRDLQRNINTSWGLVVVPNMLCIAGAFFAGFGVMHSMLFNQIGGMMAVGNGLLPLRQAARVRAAKERKLLAT